MSRWLWLAPLLLSCTEDFGRFSFTDGGASEDLAGVLPNDLTPTPPDLLPCADIYGRYTVQSSGDCGDLNDKAPECAAMTPSACFVHLSSNPLSMTGAVNGGITLNSAGQFSGQLILGTMTYPSCMGQFDGVNTLNIVCAAPTGGGTCMIQLTRTGKMCG